MSSKFLRAAVASRERLRNPYSRSALAVRYNASVLIREDGERRVASMELQPEWSVLDIGSGPGTVTIPLARRVRRVTAVEPSRTMRRLLRAYLRTENLENVRVIARPWEAVDLRRIGIHDFVIASYSLLMEDWGEAIDKMNRAARHRVEVYWFEGTTSWEHLEATLAPLVGRPPRRAARKADTVLSILASLGIAAELTPLVGTCFPKRYAGIEEAVADLRLRLGLRTSRHNTALMEYVIRNFTREGAIYAWRDTTRYVRISWRPKHHAGVGTVPEDTTAHIPAGGLGESL